MKRIRSIAILTTVGMLVSGAALAVNGETGDSYMNSDRSGNSNTGEHAVAAESGTAYNNSGTNSSDTSGAYTTKKNDRNKSHYSNKDYNSTYSPSSGSESMNTNNRSSRSTTGNTTTTGTGTTTTTGGSSGY